MTVEDPKWSVVGCFGEVREGRNAVVREGAFVMIIVGRCRVGQKECARERESEKEKDRDGGKKRAGASVVRRRENGGTKSEVAGSLGREGGSHSSKARAEHRLLRDRPARDSTAAVGKREGERGEDPV
jgi:hypothetical protein